MADSHDAIPSRYRSQRKAAANSSPHTTETGAGAGAGTGTGTGEGGLGRSRSRYHHNRPGTAHQQDRPLESTDELANVPSRSRSTRGRNSTRDAESGAADGSSDRHNGSTRSHYKSSEQSKSPTRITPAMFKDAPTHLRPKAEAFLPDAEDGDISAEETAGCMGMFGRKKKKKIAARNAAQKPLAPRPVPSRSADPPTIRPGGNGVVPMTDAPVSAQNAGERRVLIECEDKSIFLPVQLNTSASDLIASAANCLSAPIDLRTSVLVESFHSVGVVRPLRRYELVKDVMNSWDDDRANSLEILPAHLVEANPGGLSAANVTHQKPRESSFLLMYSQKPGKWDKRLITIHQDGQIVMSKPDKEAETTNICHLSDFDIYTPTAKQVSKKIKPPKKICYAIKSQQKTSMFLQTSTYVHFFCTSERVLATSFYDAVQGWRSWYLVNVMGEGKKQPRTTELGRSASKATKQSKASSHTQQPSTGSMDAHYQLGTYKPLMDLAQFDRPASSGQDAAFGASAAHHANLGNIPSRKLSTRDRSHAPTAPTKQQLADDEPLVNLAANKRASLDQDAAEREAFTGDGLLGRSYSTRQRMAAEREAAAKNPWATGPSLLKDNQADGLNRQTSIKRTASSRRNNNTDLRHRPSTRERVLATDDGLKRSGSTRAKEMPKPLVDLTPAYKPPPQHFKKGKGFHPDQVGPGGLIDNATSPEQAYYIPPSQDWRGGRANASQAASAGVSRQRSLAQRPGPNPNDEAFTGTGLVDVARGGYSGNRSVGRGVMSGNRNAQQPMLDVSEEANYVPGSLLNQVARHEREEGRGGPIIDRSK